MYKDFLPIKQKSLFLYNYYINFFYKLYKKKLLPNTILLSGQSGLGKSTFAYHFINSILSENEDYAYDFKTCKINILNKSFQFINKNCHPNFYLIENLEDKKIIDVSQIRELSKFINKTSYEKQIKFILVNNAECLNIQSINALLKITEEPGPNTYFIFIHDISVKQVETLKSRCIEFKIFFTHSDKKKILENLLNYYNLDIKKELYENLISFYDSPGNILNIIELINNEVIEPDNLDLKNVILNLIDFNINNKKKENLKILQNLLEIFFFKKLKEANNKNETLFNYSKTIKKLDFFKTYNIDMNNTFYEIKENIIHG